MPSLRLLAAALAFVPLTGGMTYTMTWSVAGGAPNQAMVAKGQVAGDNARIEFTSAGMGQQAGVYYLIKRGVQSVTVVDPAKSQYYQMDYGSLAKSLSTFVQTEYKDVSVSVQRVSPDSTIDGYATEHWRLTDDHTETTGIMIIHHTTKTHAVEDFYFAPAFKDDLNPFMKNMGRTSSSSPSAAAYYDKIEAAYAQMYHGIPLLMIMHVTSDGHDMTMTGRISDIRHADIPASVFEIPAGYQKVEMPVDTMTKTMAALNDSLKKAGVTAPSESTGSASSGSPIAGAAKAAGQGVASDAANAVTDKAKQKIHSILHLP
jgi:hypothetical protein